MSTFRIITLGLLLSLLGAPAAFAQTDAIGKRHAPDDANVTISISAAGVRFSAPGSAGQVRLEVFDAGGATVYNSEFQPGNVRDWSLMGEKGQPLTDGSYLCVVTVRGLSKRMSVRQGTVVIQGGQASLQLGEGEQVSPVESEKPLAQGAGGGGEVQPLAAGTGTQNRVAKWAETGGSGTLTDSVISEVGGNVGIGTTSPASLLHLAGPSGVNGVTLNTPGSQRFRFQTVAGVPNWGAFTLNSIYNSGWSLDDTASNGWFFKLDTRGGNGAIDSNGLWLWRIPQGPNPHVDEVPVFGITTGQAYFAGNVGIGTQSPQAALDVAGDIRVTGNAVVNGNIAAKYQDVAEWVPARQKIAAGTVVVLDTTRTNGVAPSARGYDTHVAGVVSAQPGVILGVGGEGQVLVATTGRVKVMADATRHPIRIGDLLVTSDMAGSAMKSVPVRVGGNRLHRPGTIIGKALEPLARGKGEILVLLSLQ